MGEGAYTQVENVPHISKIEMRGFKSFGNTKVSIPLSKGLTAVVGPNGMGKSNIIDALCFVLGWMSAKTMRAERFSDLLFNGAEGNRPASFAEVSLHFDNEDGGLKINSKEVAITRQVNREGKCTYRINKRRATREEIVDLLSASMTSPGGYNFILQGEVNRFFSMDPVERRKIIDELAGVAEYDDKKQKSLNELQKVEANLVNVEAVLREISTQMENLRGQMEIAIHYKQLQREHKQIQGSLLAIRKEKKDHEIKQLRQRSSKLKKEVDALRFRLDETLDRKEKHDSRIGEINRLIDEKRSSDVLVVAERARTEIKTLNSFMEGILSRKAGLDLKIEEISAQVRKLSNQTNKQVDAPSAFSKFESLRMKFGELSQALGKCESLDSAREVLGQIRSVLNQIATTIDEISKKVAEMPKPTSKVQVESPEAKLKGELIGLQRTTEEFDSQVSDIKKRMQDAQSILSGAESTEKQIRSSIDSLTAERSKIRLSAESVVKKSRALEATLRELEGKLQQWQIQERSIAEELKEIRANLKKMGSEESAVKAEVPALEKRVQEIEAELVPLADKVNFRAIQDFRESEKRHGVEKQKFDKLSSEKQSLLDFMHEIDEKKKQVFMKTFDEISEQFTKIFSELSPNGEAKLKLENELAPFEGGLEIMARPEGSVVSYMGSLSGGQKALTALAFIFALQRYRPTTFYVLDEIDAHLDPKNRVRVAEMLRKFSRESQIVVITLHDSMMSVADRLFGVTKENGISHLYSVELSGVGG